MCLACWKSKQVGALTAVMWNLQRVPSLRHLRRPCFACFKVQSPCDRVTRKLWRSHGFFFFLLLYCDCPHGDNGQRALKSAGQTASLNSISLKFCLCVSRLEWWSTRVLEESSLIWHLSLRSKDGRDRRSGHNVYKAVRWQIHILSSRSEETACAEWHPG